jgi:hypothetical protein
MGFIPSKLAGVAAVDPYDPLGTVPERVMAISLIPKVSVSFLCVYFVCALGVFFFAAPRVVFSVFFLPASSLTGLHCLRSTPVSLPVRSVVLFELSSRELHGSPTACRVPHLP